MRGRRDVSARARAARVLPLSNWMRASAALMIVHQFVAFALYVTPLIFMFERAGTSGCPCGCPSVSAAACRAARAACVLCAVGLTGGLYYTLRACGVAAHISSAPA